MWNHFILLFFKADISVDQESTLSPIFSALYIASFFYIFEKRTKILLIPILVSILFLLIIVFLFLREKVTKNQIQSFLIVIVSFYLFLANLV